MSNKKIIKCIKNKINISSYFHDIGYSDGYNSYRESDYLSKRFNDIIDGYYDNYDNYDEEDDDSTLYDHGYNSVDYEDDEYCPELYEDKTIYYYISDTKGNLGKPRLTFHNLYEFDSFLSMHGYDVSSDDVYSYVEYDVIHCCLDPSKHFIGEEILISDISYDNLEKVIKDKWGVN